MLKISTHVTATKVTFELEGRLAGPWVDELERCWQEIPPGYAVTVSLHAVAFIDSDGKALLGRFHESGAELKASGCMTTCIVHEITRKKPAELR
jgi:hypothetical protein